MKKALALFLSLSILAVPASATWSIVVVNARTGEVGVASATCLTDFNLRRAVPVVVVGRGAAAAQSSIDQGAVNRKVIFRSFRRTSLTPQEILELLATSDAGHQTRQYGIVSFTGDPLTFTGAGAGAAASGVTGQIGDYVYAIQGNLLTGDQVVVGAVDAFRETDGDMGQRLMAAMQAARHYGGDGRCSCSSMNPTNCGAPPRSFEKSAHVGFVIVARSGDPDGKCNGMNGCANAPYYLRFNVVGGESDPDPVDTLQASYDDWRAQRIARPDGILSSISGVDSMPADGVTKRIVTIQLRDIDGHPIAHGGADVEVRTAGGARALTTLGPVLDHGDGSYSFPMTAGNRPGIERLEVVASDDLVTATLYPPFEVSIEAPTALHAGLNAVSASHGATVPFHLNLPDHPRSAFWVLASLAGSQPGVDLARSHLPLNPDVLTRASLRWAGRSPLLAGTHGVLDPRGHADGAFVAPPGLLLDVVGMRLHWAGIIAGDGALQTTNAVSFEIAP